MNDSDLENLLTDAESDRVERKSALSEPDRIREAICAFANDLPGHGQPGVLFVGARDDGSCAGLRITDELLIRLAQMRDDGLIQPLPSLVVEKRVLRGCELAVVMVHPALAPPVRFRGLTWIRVGPRRGIATPDEERRLAERRRSRDLPFDLQPVSSAAIEDLDLDYFAGEYLPQAVAPDSLVHNDRSMEDRMRGLRFLTPDGVPTVLGILVLGRDPRRFLPGAYVQFLRLDATELTDAVRDQKEIGGPVAQVLWRLDDVLEAHNSVAASLTAARLEVTRPEYPLPALQQLTTNAVLHRSYEGTNAPVRVYWFADRIEIHSPGGPFGQVNPENFGRPGVTDYRNPHLAEALKILGFVQKFGAGIPIARQSLEKNANPPVEFVVEPNHVLAVVRRRS